MTDSTPASPRFLCKAILRHEGQWMVTYPDYEGMGDNPFAVRDATRLLTSEELTDWFQRRLGRIEFDRQVPKTEPDLKMKKLPCGHSIMRRKGAYPKTCERCR